MGYVLVIGERIEVERCTVCIGSLSCPSHVLSNNEMVSFLRQV